MRSVETTHVGSLPFTNPKDAINYSFQFDLPVLFSLPNFDSSQFMGKDIVDMLDIGVYTNDHKIELNETYQLSTKEINPPFLDLFIEEMSKRGKSNFKYQLVGPITFYKLVSSTDDVCLEEIGEFLFQKYKNLLNTLRPLGLKYFSLDEPSLRGASSDEILFLVDFTTKLEEVTKTAIIIHSCAKLDLENIGKLRQLALNLDLSLYSNEEISKLGSIKFIGFAKGTPNPQHKIGAILDKMAKKCFILPSCGLVYENEQSLEHLFNNLRETKMKFLDRNT